MIQRPRFVDGEEPFREYPRPQMRRNSYFSLNGEWDYAITKTRKEPGEYDGKIRVPYPPESEASGVKRVVGARDYLHYRRGLDGSVQQTAQAVQKEVPTHGDLSGTGSGGTERRRTGEVY